MLLTPQQDECTNDLNVTNTTLSPRRHRQLHTEDGESPDYHVPDQIFSNSSKYFSPRSGQRAKVPPHIKICPPDEHGVIGSYDFYDDELDNDVFQSPKTFASSPPTHSSASLRSDEKHQVHSGRLYLVRHTGNACISSSPSRSPVSSPTQSPAISFLFGSSPPTSIQQSPSPGSSPTSSSMPPLSPKTSVYVRVYRCNTEHFAIITRDLLLTSKPMYVNMRHCRVMPGDCLGRFIVAGQCDSGNIVEFEVPELSSLEQWLDAFHVCTPPTSPSRSFVGSGGGGVNGSGVSPTSPVPRTPALPTLAETEEED